MLFKNQEQYLNFRLLEKKEFNSDRLKQQYLESNYQNQKPKLRLYRLTEERKIVPIKLEITINEKLKIRDRFDWNLQDEHITVQDFVNKFLEQISQNGLELPKINEESIKEQILKQLWQHVEYYSSDKFKQQMFQESIQKQLIQQQLYQQQKQSGNIEYESNNIQTNQNQNKINQEQQDDKQQNLEKNTNEIQNELNIVEIEQQVEQEMDNTNLNDVKDILEAENEMEENIIEEDDENQEKKESIQQKNEKEIVDHHPLPKVYKKRGRKRKEQVMQRQKCAHIYQRFSLRQQTLIKNREQEEEIQEKRSQLLRRLCRFCKYYHPMLQTECHQCKVPYKFSQNADFENIRHLLSLKFLSLIINEIPYINQSIIKDQLQISDLDSVLKLKNKLCELLQWDQNFQEKGGDVEHCIQLTDELIWEFNNGKYNEEMKQYIEKEKENQNAINLQQQINSAEEESDEEYQFFKLQQQQLQPFKRKRGRPRKIFHTQRKITFK